MTVMRGHLGSVLELRTNATLVASSSADGSVCLWKPQVFFFFFFFVKRLFLVSGFLLVSI